MNLITLANASLQVIATGFIAGGGSLIFNSHDNNDLISGVILIILGIICYIVYEKFPDSPKN